MSLVISAASLKGKKMTTLFIKSVRLENTNISYINIVMNSFCYV
jgi:hypothetical protein